MNNEKDIFDYIKAKKVDVPDTSYFETLADNIIAKDHVKVIPIYKKPLFWMSSAAAAILIFFVAFNFTDPNSIQDKPLLALNDIDNDLVYSYVHENINDFDTELLTEFISETDIESDNSSEDESVQITEENITIESNTITLENISSEDILNYFESEAIDISDLEDELFI